MLRRTAAGLLIRATGPLLQGWGDGGGGGGGGGWGDGASAGAGGGGGGWGESSGGGGGGWGESSGGGGGAGGGGWGSSGGWGDGDAGWRNAPVGGRRGGGRGNFRRGRGGDFGGRGGGGVWGQSPAVDEESWNVASPSFQPPVRRVDPLTLTAVEVEIDGVKKLVGQRVQVTGIADDTRWQTLKDHLRQAGEVTFCRIFPSGRALVEFTTPEDAARAVTELQGSDLEGSTIYLREDREDTVLVNTRRKIREAREAQLREKKKEAEQRRREEAIAQGDAHGKHEHGTVRCAVDRFHPVVPVPRTKSIARPLSSHTPIYTDNEKKNIHIHQDAAPGAARKLIEAQPTVNRNERERKNNGNDNNNNNNKKKTTQKETNRIKKKKNKKEHLGASITARNKYILPTMSSALLQREVPHAYLCTSNTNFSTTTCCLSLSLDASTISSMRIQQRIDFSIRKPRIERVIAVFGASGASPVHRGAAAGRVADALLDACRPPPSDVHDTERCRVDARNANGEARQYFAAYTRSAAGRRRTAGALRSPQRWDSEPASDYGGVWCDRLLLGVDAAPRRCALLRPRVPLAFQPEALQRVGQAHSHLSAQDLLLVDTTPALPLGVLRLWGWEAYLGAAPQWDGADARRLTGDRSVVGCSLVEALESFASPASSPSVLAVGCGAELPAAAPLTPGEEAVMALAAPCAAFAAALWTVRPSVAAEYLVKQTPDASALRERQRCERVWGEMQNSMLSTRDAALLHAHYTNTRLDKRLSVQHQTYLAETLLRRLYEGSKKNNLEYKALKPSLCFTDKKTFVSSCSHTALVRVGWCLCFILHNLPVFTAPLVPRHLSPQSLQPCWCWRRPSSFCSIDFLTRQPPRNMSRHEYFCRKCRGRLFAESELVPHDPPAGGGKGFKRQEQLAEASDEWDWGDAGPAVQCTSYFLDPDVTPWVAEKSRDAHAEGELEPDTIYCPHLRCGAKIGTQAWSGTRCSCGAWVTPAFKILCKAVDKIPVAA
eukprot:gene4161-3002_t